MSRPLINDASVAKAAAYRYLYSRQRWLNFADALVKPNGKLIWERNVGADQKKLSTAGSDQKGDIGSKAGRGSQAPKREVSFSVERALQILINVAKTPKPASFVDLQKCLALPKATLHKLLSTLEEWDFLRRDEESGKYTIGLAVFEVAAGGSTSTDIRTLVNPILRNLSREYDEACNLGILDGGEMVYVDRVDPPEQIVRLASLVGRRIPAYASAGGTAAFASLYDEAILTLFPATLQTAPTRGHRAHARGASTTTSRCQGKGLWDRPGGNFCGCERGRCGDFDPRLANYCHQLHHTSTARTDRAVA